MGKYRGETILDTLIGDGCRNYNNGDQYLGEWENNEREGYGKMFVFMENLYYFGEWKKGKLHGLGCVRPKNERWVKLYKGEWENGERNGVGIGYIPDGKIIYKGSFKDNKRNGKGIEI